MFFCACGGNPPPEDRPVARAGQASIARNELQAAYGLPTVGPEGPDSSAWAGWEEAARDWAVKAILIQEAQKRRLDQDSLFLARINNLSQELLINLLYERAGSNIEADSSEVREEYDGHRMEYVSPADQVDLLYVLAPTRELAGQARRALQEGSPLDGVLALDESLSGAAVGWVTLGDLNPQIAKPTFTLLPGGISYPQKREDGGFVLLQCRQRRSQGTVLPIEEVFADIYHRVLQRKRSQAEKELRDSLWAAYRPEIFLGARKERESEEE